ncbi:hypothetical protein TWF694_006366 [Orbilia ellipsospora]|uniref:Uncharacterized protein n=1 Tax=Orbilia ellipsospora TaxID=2528407 RepID=A0AAV9XLB2_9PEZI
MHLPSTVVAVGALLSLVPGIAGHGMILDAWGDVDPSCRGKGIGATTKSWKDIKFLRDVPVFSNPTIPDKSCHKCPQQGSTRCAECICKGKNCGTNIFKPGCKCKYANWNLNCAACRQYLPDGCGRTATNPAGYAHWYLKDPKGYSKKSKCCGMAGQTSLNTEIIVNQLIKNNNIPKVKAGGNLHLSFLQVNADGAGPFMCRIDMTAQATQWDATNLTITTNVPGDGGFLGPGYKKLFPMVIQLPEDLKCTGTSGGMSNMCIVRCENFAPNGPFGGCVAVQQIPNPPKETTTVTVTDVPGPTGTPTPDPGEDDEDSYAYKK